MVTFKIKTYSASRRYGQQSESEKRSMMALIGSQQTISTTVDLPTDSQSSATVNSAGGGGGTAGMYSISNGHHSSTAMAASSSVAALHHREAASRVGGTAIGNGLLADRPSASTARLQEGCDDRLERRRARWAGASFQRSTSLETQVILNTIFCTATMTVCRP